jgi:hypothetical protein
MPVVRTTGARARRAHDGALMALTLRTLVLATLLALGGGRHAFKFPEIFVGVGEPI